LISPKEVLRVSRSCKIQAESAANGGAKRGNAGKDSPRWEREIKPRALNKKSKNQLREERGPIRSVVSNRSAAAEHHLFCTQARWRDEKSALEYRLAKINRADISLRKRQESQKSKALDKRKLKKSTKKGLCSEDEAKNKDLQREKTNNKGRRRKR